MSRRRLTVALTVFVASACGDVNVALERLTEARHVSADLLVQFTKATDAANRAVMATTDDASQGFAREADAAKQAVQTDVDRLGAILREVKYTDEAGLLEEFNGRFAEYRTLDSQVLGLAVENTNLKAQRLSFGPALEAADAFRDALDAAIAAARSQDMTQIRAQAMTAVAAVREIQALQAPHIAEPDDAVMTRFETRMTAAEGSARKALDTLGGLNQSALRSPLSNATAALDRFVKAHAEIVALSRKNTNVRSLTLSLDEKRKLIARCEESLRALRDALAKRGYPGGRTT